MRNTCYSLEDYPGVLNPRNATVSKRETRMQFFQVSEERGAAEALQELDDSIADKASRPCDSVATMT